MLDPIKTSDFCAIRLKVASPEDILKWSYGEVTRPETINYRTQKPEKAGLFCERIFGPSKDWECYCGKYKKNRYKGIVCDKCGVEVTRSIVRRERMGHIQLETPTTHIWFLRGTSSKISITLDLSVSALEKVVYYASFIITNVNEELRNETLEQIKEEFKTKSKAIEKDFKAELKTISDNEKSDESQKNNTAQKIEQLEKAKEEKLSELTEIFDIIQKELNGLKPMAIISENSYQELSQKFGHIFEAGIGAIAIKTLLKEIDITKTIERLEDDLLNVVDSKKEKLTRRLKHFKSLKANQILPESMILDVIPIIPPDLRPMVALDGGRFAASDLNDLYRRVINRNNRLKQLMGLNAPEVITRNEKRMLQEAVDALIDNSARQSKTVVASTGQKRNLKSLADSLKGKQGRFRQNLLGKRIDYSGRSVIVVNPYLKLNECGLPKSMALELFKPFIISKLIKRELVHNVRSASKFIESGKNEVWDILEEIIEDAHVLLNRAPTLHRLGIQAFKPKLIEGKAIQIHPLTCTAFNADFDGDQMAVHVPLTSEAKAEARDIMLSSKNLLKPATGDPIVTPSQDIVWGTYYMTRANDLGEESNTLKHYTNPEEAKMAYEFKVIKLDQIINVRINGILTRTTVGRLMFNEMLPTRLRYVNEVVAKGKLKNIVKQCFLEYGPEKTVLLLDDLKLKSFAIITKSGLSWGMNDTPHYEEKYTLVKEANKKVVEIQDQFDEGLLTESERYAKVIELWSGVKERVTETCKTGLAKDGYNNPLFSMIDSGARGSWTQLTQIIGMKGLVTSPSGDIIELPVKGNFKHGFDVIEYFISTHGVRKGLSDTALRTANAGYLTRRLVDVAQDTIINDKDCGEEHGIVLTEKESEAMGFELTARITGRYLSGDLVNTDGKVLLKKGELITDDIAAKLKKEQINEAPVRSVLSCKLMRGVCSKCYGIDLGHNKIVKKGTAVGIIAAQSIGEPGTQLTMRTFHTGGVASSEDITQGLPRVEEIFEARNPKRKAYIAEVGGKVIVESSQRTIMSGDKEITTINPQSKVIKIAYEGSDADKYVTSHMAKKLELSSKNDDKKTLIEVKILVTEGDEVSARTELYKVGGKIIKAKRGGTVTIENPKSKTPIIIVTANSSKIHEYIIPKGTGILIKDGDIVKKGDQLTDGSIDLQQLFLLKDRLETQKYIIREIQHVYSSQGQPLNDKHIELIVKQMFSRYFVTTVGDTDLLPGEIIERGTFLAANKKAKKKGKMEATGELLLLGISKASLTTESFLSAASFQETNRVLIEAAINGKVDHLRGLKENVIVGRLIPVGTGYKS
ncbi:DNA-directed RNA polymerase subunit beta' [Patescibacteria group bacterium]|nr:DNA-directed RNA polymerase subunit beta' [Patescibacteria group bacterium]